MLTPRAMYKRQNRDCELLEYLSPMLLTATRGCQAFELDNTIVRQDQLSKLGVYSTEDEVDMGIWNEQLKEKAGNEVALVVAMVPD